MQQIQNTLYVMTPQSYVHLDNATLRVDVDHEKRLQVPLHHVGTLVCFGDVMVSPALMHRLAEEGKSLVLLDRFGRFKARLEGPVSGNILLRQAQHRGACDVDVTRDLARACVAGKIRNGRTVLLRAARESKEADDAKQLAGAADHLAASLRAAAEASTVDALRGIEGDAARSYFSAFNCIVKPAMREQFQWSGRTRRPPLDRINALLSFLYSMLMNDCRSALETVGLDPQLGFLHVVRPGRAALALDLQEEFRAPICDRLALTLVNRGQLSEGDFEAREGGAVLLGDKGRRKVVAAWQERKQEEVTHPLLEQKVLIGLLPFVQARLMARAIREETTGYLPYLSR
jgi:CRISPR-associated protein Cas1